MEKLRELHFYKNYFFDFFDSQPEKVKNKIDQVLYVISIADRIPKKFFDHISGAEGLYEIRVEFNSNIYRIFCCFDYGNIVVLFNGFQKKAQKTSTTEIERALKIKKEYFNNKQIKSHEKKNRKN